jgi:aminodeoxyfutalosine deaminase
VKATVTTLRAKWVFPVGQPPIRDGTLTYALTQRSPAQRPAAVLMRIDSPGRRRPDRDLGNVALLPGFVNAHTHLDLTDAFGKIPPTVSFTDWLGGVIRHRMSQSPGDVGRAVESGCEQLLQTGATLVGDISAQGASWNPLRDAQIESIVFREVLGLSPERRTASMAEAKAWWLDRDVCNAHPHLSPHAPYSTAKSLFRECERFSPEWPTLGPMAVHVAESEAERELIENRTGPLVDFLKGLGSWSFAETELIRDFSEIGDRYLAIHANYLRVDEVRGPVVYCPRTHAAFGHRPHPFREFLNVGIPVALGTDSLASNPDLDVLAEARFLARRHPDVAPATILEMLTKFGAVALGREKECGTLAAGKEPSLVVLPVPDIEVDDPHELLFMMDEAPSAVMYRGQWRFGGPT